MATSGEAPPQATRILIVDDHPIVRLGIRQLIGSQKHLTVCGEAATAKDALAFVNASPPDLAIVDLSLQDATGLDLIRAVRTAAPGVRVLVLSMHDEALFAERALRAGAHAYIMKQEAIDGLLHAIDEVLAGRLYVTGRMSQQILQRLQSDQLSGDRLAGLSDRELEVFELIGRGVGTAAIAERLDVSVKTVETYRSNIKTKLGLKDATELIRFAASWGERL